MQYGKQEGNKSSDEWFASLEAEGHQVKTDTEPPDMRGLEWLWIAWMDLDSCRQIGMEAGNIPWTAVDQYASRYGLSEDEFDLLWYCVRQLDSMLREHVKSKPKPKLKGGPNAPKRNPRR